MADGVGSSGLRRNRYTNNVRPYTVHYGDHLYEQLNSDFNDVFYLQFIFSWSSRNSP